MVTTELGACEWFVWDLRRSNLIDRGHLDQVVSEFLQTNPRAEPPALAEYLVAQGVISEFQAERLLQGKTQGFVLGAFTLMDALGVGSMGTVYKATSKTDGRWYAVKVLPRRSMWNVRIARRKVRACEVCRLPAIVPFVDVGTSGGMHYLAWPFVEGQTLEKLVKENGPLPPEQVGAFAFQMAEGLEVCHHNGLFHGLFKPSNVMLGNDGQIYILDLGIGTLLAETEGESLVDTMSTANSVASGLDCASPESIMDPTNLTPTGDQYSLGCTLYFLITGKFPFPEGTAAEKMMAHQFKEPTPITELNPECPHELVDITERLMQKAPENRFPTTSEVVEALRPFAGNVAPPTEPIWAGGRYSSSTTETPPTGGMPRPSLPTMSNVPSGSTGSPNFPARGAAPTTMSMPTREAFPTKQGMDQPDLLGNNLPSRQQLLDKQERATQSSAQNQLASGQERQIPGGVEEGSTKGSWEEKLGTVGIAVGAIVAGVLAWIVASRLF